MVTKVRVLIKIRTIQNLGIALKKHMFHKEDDGRRAMFCSILNLTLLNMLIHATEGPNGKETDVDYKNLVLCRIMESIFGEMLHGLDDVVKQGWLYAMNKVYGINWKANVDTAQDIVNTCDGKYDRFGTLLE
jgi:hypothetical protein